MSMLENFRKYLDSIDLDCTYHDGGSSKYVNDEKTVVIDNFRPYDFVFDGISDEFVPVTSFDYDPKDNAVEVTYIFHKLNAFPSDLYFIANAINKSYFHSIKAFAADDLLFAKLFVKYRFYGSGSYWNDIQSASDVARALIEKIKDSL